MLRYLLPVFLFLNLYGEWTMYRADLKNTGKVDEPLMPPLALVWKYEIGAPVVSSPAVKDGILYIGARDGYLYAISIKNGALRWKFKTGRGVDCTPLVYKNMVFFTARDGYVYCIDRRTGALKWHKKMGGMMMSSPKPYGNTIIFGRGHPRPGIVCVNIRDGSIKWEVRADQFVYSTIAIDGDTGFIGANDGKLYAISLKDGRLLWTKETKGMFYVNSPVVDDRVYAVPGYRDNTLHIYTKNGKKQKLALKMEVKKIEAGLPYPIAQRLTGVKISRKVISYLYVSSPALSEKSLVYVAGQNLYCVDKFADTVKWKYNVGSPLKMGYVPSPVITDSIIWVVSATGVIYAFTESGKLLFSDSLHSNVFASPVVSDNMLFVASYDGHIYAFSSTQKPSPGIFPERFTFYPNYPNPFRGKTTIKFAVPFTENKIRVRIVVYDVCGREVSVITDKDYAPGVYILRWSGEDKRGRSLPPGIYFCRMEAGKFNRVRKIVKIR